MFMMTKFIFSLFEFRGVNKEFKVFLETEIMLISNVSFILASTHKIKLKFLLLILKYNIFTKCMGKYLLTIQAFFFVFLFWLISETTANFDETFTSS